MSDIPTIEEELSRKSGEALLWAENEFVRGSISPAQLETALTVFDMTTMGLIDMEFSDWAAERRSTAKKQPPDTTIFYNSKMNLMLTAELDRVEGRVRYIQHGKSLSIGQWKTFENETDQIKAASDYYLSSLEKIKSKGWGIL